MQGKRSIQVNVQLYMPVITMVISYLLVNIGGLSLTSDMITVTLTVVVFLLS